MRINLFKCIFERTVMAITAILAEKAVVYGEMPLFAHKLTS